MNQIKNICISTAASNVSSKANGYETSAYSVSNVEGNAKSTALTNGKATNNYSGANAYGSGNNVNTQSGSSIQYPGNVYSNSGGYSQGEYASSSSSGYSNNGTKYNTAKTDASSSATSNTVTYPTYETYETYGYTWSNSWR